MCSAPLPASGSSGIEFITLYTGKKSPPLLRGEFNPGCRIRGIPYIHLSHVRCLCHLDATTVGAIGRALEGQFAIHFHSYGSLVAL